MDVNKYVHWVRAGQFTTGPWPRDDYKLDAWGARLRVQRVL